MHIHTRVSRFWLFVCLASLVFQTLVSLLSFPDLTVVFSALTALIALGRKGASLKGFSMLPMNQNRLQHSLLAMCHDVASSSLGLDLVTVATSNDAATFEKVPENPMTVGFLAESHVGSGDVCAQKVVLKPVDILARDANVSIACAQFCDENNVPLTARFSILSRLRIASRITSSEGRQELVKMRILAFTALIQSTQISQDHGTSYPLFLLLLIFPIHPPFAYRLWP